MVPAKNRGGEARQRSEACELHSISEASSPGRTAAADGRSIRSWGRRLAFCTLCPLVDLPQHTLMPGNEQIDNPRWPTCLCLCLYTLDHAGTALNRAGLGSHSAWSQRYNCSIQRHESGSSAFASRVRFSRKRAIRSWLKGPLL